MVEDKIASENLGKCKMRMIQLIKDWIKHGVERFGYTLTRIGSESFYNRLFADHMVTLFEKLDIHCVIDVGGGSGQYRDFLRNEVGYKGLIISFEPVKKQIEILNAKAQKDPQWMIYGHALGSENTRIEINVMKSCDFSSFANPDSSIVGEFRCENAVDYRETVEVKRLDSIMPTLQAKHQIRNIFLKTDTQGFDLAVVNGTMDMLSTVRALQMELSIRKLYENIPDYLDVLRTMADKGFNITGLFPVTRDNHLRVIELDCVMINAAYTDLSPK